MSKNCPVMKRMKEAYEKRSQTFLTRRTPVILRCDGKAFHTYLKGAKKPFDNGVMEDMDDTAIYLCQNIQGAKCAYVQSDEISILITDYDTLNTDSWFDYSVQKMTSISASLATGRFNQLRVNRELSDNWEEDEFSLDELLDDVVSNYKLAFFDSRVFNIPKEEVANYFLARQKDAVKNSIASVAQSLYSHKELYKKNQSDLQEMIFQKGINWDDYSFGEKRGRFIKKVKYENQDKNGQFFERYKWEVVETPLNFKEEDFKEWL